MSDDAFELVRLRGGAWGIRSRAYDEVCHPGIGPEAEAEALYVRGLDLVARAVREAREGGEFVIWDVGLGGAANAATAIRAITGGGGGGRLRVLSFDRQLDQLAFAVRHAGALGYFHGLESQAGVLVDAPVVEFARAGWTVRWQRCQGDFPAWLTAESGPGGGAPAPHAILFDPHSPAANPEVWTLPVFAALFARLDPGRGCTLATYSRSTAVRAALLLGGFWVGAGGGTETKEETTLAANRRELVPRLLDARWLERAGRSRAAEPWTVPPFGGRPWSEATAARVRGHPQFAS